MKGVSCKTSLYHNGSFLLDFTLIEITWISYQFCRKESLNTNYNLQWLSFFHLQVSGFSSICHRRLVRIYILWIPQWNCMYSKIYLRSFYEDFLLTILWGTIFIIQILRCSCKWYTSPSNHKLLEFRHKCLSTLSFIYFSKDLLPLTTSTTVFDERTYHCMYWCMYDACMYIHTSRLLIMIEEGST